MACEYQLSPCVRGAFERWECGKDLRLTDSFLQASSSWFPSRITEMVSLAELEALTSRWVRISS